MPALSLLVPPATDGGSEGGEDSTDFFGLAEQIVELILPEIAYVDSNVEMRP